MTNLEKIRSMSAEELALWLDKHGDCNMCEAAGYCNAVASCKDAFMLWLNEEADNE